MRDNMKARVKATGEIVELLQDGDMYYCTDKVKWFHNWELDFIDDTDEEDILDYWTRLEHQYAGMAMTGICANPSYDEASYSTMADDAIGAAHALVEKMKEKEERK